MAKLSIYFLRGALDGCEVDFVQFLLNQTDCVNGRAKFMLDEKSWIVRADTIVRSMAVSDPENFARCALRYIAHCVGSGNILSDVEEHESKWRTPTVAEGNEKKCSV